MSVDKEEGGLFVKAKVWQITNSRSNQGSGKNAIALPKIPPKNAVWPTKIAFRSIYKIVFLPVVETNSGGPTKVGS